ncbi:hypothetical protein IH575_01480 [Candidatus Dojkabacteria bacterium]|nr:hypothetical protein [Candidatus Dojkabacteria bacterium]
MQILEFATEPLVKLNTDLQQITSFQSTLAEYLSEQRTMAQKIVSDAVGNVGLLDITNTFKGVQLEAFAGLTIKSKLIESLETINNGIVEVSTIKESRYLAGGSLKLGIEKSISTEVSAQIVYKRLDQINAYVQSIDENYQTVDTRITSIEKQLTEKNTLLHILENNPFKYFKIKKIDYQSGYGLLIVNNDISIQIPKYTRMEDLCTILFSGHQNLGEEWFLDSIQEAWEIFIDNEKAKDITWSNILSTVDDINTLFAKKTTREDLILVEKPKMIRLNPKYFLSEN